MAVRAMGRSRFVAITAPDILGVRHEFEMSRIQAGRVSAEMIWLKAIWDRTDQLFEGESMRESRPTFNHESPVTQPIAVTVPLPAAIS